MVFLSLAPDKMEQSFQCNVIEVNGKLVDGTSKGYVKIDPYSHSGPSIQFDETIRGFAIRHEDFHPRWQSFVFEEENGVGYLTIINISPSYTLVVQF